MRLSLRLGARGRRTAVWALVVLASLLVFVGSLTVWVKREALNTDRVSASSGKLLESEEVRTALSAFLADELYANVDVEAQIADALPHDLERLAGPIAGALRAYAQRAAFDLLGSRATIGTVELATRTAHAQFLYVVENHSGHPGPIYLDLRPVLLALAGRLGLEHAVAVRIPPDAARVLLLKDDGRIVQVRRGIRLLKALSFFLTLVVVALYALAFWLARGRRRETLVRIGCGLVVASALVLVVRSVLGSVLLNDVAGSRPVRPAAAVVYGVLTDLLATIAWTEIAFGLVAVAVGLVTGPSRGARRVRTFLAPGLVRRPAVLWAAVALLVVLALTFTRIEDWSALLSRLTVVAVIAVGAEALRRQAAREHPDGGWTLAAVAGGLRPVGGRRATTAGELERLAALRDRGVLTPAEFEAQKQALLSASR